MACPLSRKQRCFSCSHTTPLCTHVLLVDRLLPFVRLTAGANAGFTVTGACRAGGTPASFSQKQLALGVSRANPQDKHVHTYLAPPTTFLLLPQSCPDELRALTCLPARASPKKPPDLPIFFQRRPSVALSGGSSKQTWKTFGLSGPGADLGKNTTWTSASSLQLSIGWYLCVL